MSLEYIVQRIIRDEDPKSSSLTKKHTAGDLTAIPDYELAEELRKAKLRVQILERMSVVKTQQESRVNSDRSISIDIPSYR